MLKALVTAAVAALFGIASPASAATLVTTANTLFCSCGSVGSAALQPFDSNLGTLTGVTLQVDAEKIFAFITTYTDFRLEAGSAQLAFQSPFDVLFNGLPYTLEVSGAKSLSYTGPAAPFGIQSFTASGSATFTLDQSLFSTFIGTASNCGGSIGVCVTGNTRNSGGYVVSSNNLSFLDTDTAAIGRYTLTYTYTPFGVPEPTTWAMMLLGFCAVGVALRRDRYILADR